MGKYGSEIFGDKIYCLLALIMLTLSNVQIDLMPLTKSNTIVHKT